MQEVDEDCEPCHRQESRAKAGTELSHGYLPRGGRTWAIPRPLVPWLGLAGKERFRFGSKCSGMAH